MSDPKAAAEAAKVAADVINGPGTPEAVKVVQRVDGLGVWMKGLSGPAVCGLLITFAFLAADWIPILGKQSIWTETTEEIRAQGVVIALVILAACVGIVLWTLHAGKPTRTEIKAGPVGVTIEQDSEPSAAEKRAAFLETYGDPK